MQTATTTTPTGTTGLTKEVKTFAAEGLYRDFDFSDIKLDALIREKHNMIRVLNTTTLEEALDIMRLNKISALPIYDFTKRSYIGILSFFDIVVYVAFGSFKKKLVKADFQNLGFGRMQCGDLLAISDPQRMIWNFDENDSLEAILEPMSKGVHRVIVNKRRSFSPEKLTKKEKTIIPGTAAIEAEIQNSVSSLVGPPTHEVKHRVLSQIDVVSFLYHWANDKRIPMLRRSLEELSLVGDHRGRLPIVVPETMSAIDAMQQMYKSNVNALGVVDEAGKLEANFSNTDIRYMTHQQLPSIFMPICLFLNQIHGEKPAKPITVHPHSTLDEVMLKMVTAKVKRVWIVDSAQVPLGVVTLSDVISKFSRQDVTLITQPELTPRR